MAFVHPGDGALDYFSCHYGMSRLTFRGPRRDLTGEYLAMLGGTVTHGRFVIAPFPALVEERLGVPVANLGVPNAGPDVYLGDRGVGEVAGAAHLAVLQVLGAQNQTNRFYTVHPRRNDRFIAATPLLRSMYRDVDFTEFHFTRHLIHALWARGPERLAPVVEELRNLWLVRMRGILARMPQRRVLVWTGSAPPPESFGPPNTAPMFIDRGLVEALVPDVSAYVEHVASPAAQAEGVRAMRFTPAEESAAQELPGAAAHREMAEALAPVIERLL
ncbi:DUF6473 family protein [Rhodobacter sp. Har01]|uniref:DUF6473 family protein n=1 Tax=Rhodobacter sp. Har01 TaxID=2883999 RepID=UPI001D080F7C|nr:DUF6473 family protein [Rhodobacter sp. Har01]MCB6177641.1 DUF6473 family protein [Rhodobacter sp. Har01]